MALREFGESLREGAARFSSLKVTIASRLDAVVKDGVRLSCAAQEQGGDSQHAREGGALRERHREDIAV